MEPNSPSPIIIIRHAQPTDCSAHAVSHWTDTDLTDLGRRQAECVAQRMQRELGSAPCVLYSSDLRRAAQTAAPIAEKLGMEVIPVPELREFNNGLSAGGSEEALVKSAAQSSAASRDLLTNPAGESWTQFYQRVSTCMDRLTKEQGRTVVVVAHYGTIINIMTWWLRIGLTATGDTPASFEASLASVAVLKRSRQNKPALERLNDTSHLLAAGLAV